MKIFPTLENLLRYAGYHRIKARRDDTNSPQPVTGIDGARSAGRREDGYLYYYPRNEMKIEGGKMGA